MMQGRIESFLRIGLPCVLALFLVLAFVPSVFGDARMFPVRRAPVGPKDYYLVLGDSLAFGYQPDLDWDNGYGTLFFRDLTKRGGRYYDNLACVGESSVTMIRGGCPYAILHKYIYTGSQLQAAVNFLHKHAGRVSPVTLDIGINDLLPDFESAKCTIDARWERNLATLDSNLRNVILPQLSAALTVNRQVSGDLLLLNYYDPYQDRCPNTLQAIQTLNRHLAADSSGYAIPVDVFGALRGPLTGKTALPVASVCKYTWMCSAFKDVHPNKKGYSAMASAIEHTINY